MMKIENIEPNMNFAVSFLNDIVYDYQLQDIYTEKYYDEIIVRCKYYSDEYRKYVCQDKRVIDNWIEPYNEHHPYDDYNYATYVMMFPHTRQSIAQCCLNSDEHTIFNSDTEYEFKFIIKKSDDVPTFAEFRQSLRDDEIQKLIDIESMKIEDFNKLFDEHKTTRPSFLSENDVDTMIDVLKQVRYSKRRTINKKISKYDTNGNLIETYKNRKECMQKNDIKKSMLSQHLNGKKYSIKGYIYKEE